jgi:hypothetical protein
MQAAGCRLGLGFARASGHDEALASVGTIAAEPFAPVNPAGAAQRFD